MHDAGFKEFKIPEEIQNLELADVNGIKAINKLDRWGDDVRGVINSVSERDLIQGRDVERPDGAQKIHAGANEEVSAEVNAMHLVAEENERYQKERHKQIALEVEQAMELIRRDYIPIAKPNPYGEVRVEGPKGSRCFCPDKGSCKCYVPGC